MPRKINTTTCTEKEIQQRQRNGKNNSARMMLDILESEVRLEASNESRLFKILAYIQILLAKSGLSPEKIANFLSLLTNTPVDIRKKPSRLGTPSVVFKFLTECEANPETQTQSQDTEDEEEEEVETLKALEERVQQALATAQEVREELRRVQRKATQR